VFCDVSELTPYGWKAKWAPVVEAHRTSIVERLVRKRRRTLPAGVELGEKGIEVGIEESEVLRHRSVHRQASVDQMGWPDSSSGYSLRRI
jgi:hypothetical protein